ncbi:UvrD-helicase domain-containing protein [Acinetobacter johnsonii]|uniref:UvrD-helicase domain-containing protein n=1 Tax=Acinetobacter johnsonii TaxID=40214 RepID=A0AA42U8F6_ACIJO|nr:UvrD-helicase domain-containing protein [Acinetobacter johnsonii]MDH1439342.1 UvrD-helicase domain-containing protein [Acinetobacter johnsonii]
MKLTDDQLKAIQYIENNSAIMACPGSGKTTILINKMVVCHKKMKKHNGFIALSFTKKSSYDLKLRFNKIGNNSINNFFGTIDDFFLNEIIRPFLSNIWKGNSKELEVVKILNKLESQHFIDDPSRKRISLKDIEDENRAE